MKVRATIMESVDPIETLVIVRFEGDPAQQHFESKFKEVNTYN